MNVGEPVRQGMYSIECFIIDLGLTDVPVYVIKDIIMPMFPLLCWVLFILFYKIVC